jgi:hypothetical protein
MTAIIDKNDNGIKRQQCHLSILHKIKFLNIAAKNYRIMRLILEHQLL